MRTYLAAGLVALTATPALAGGVERSNQSMAILFEQGNYLEFGASYSRPRVSGNTVDPFVGPSSGNMAKSFWNLDLRFKGQINENLSYAIIIDQPIGADVAYPTDTGYAAQGAEGSISSTSLSGILRYQLDNGVSVYGGLRAVRTKGSVSLPFAGQYTMETNTDTAYGYLVGAAWERPDIAARVALTYHSRIKHSFDATEASLFTGLAPIETSFNTTIPESVNLEFQTGIAEDTLLFGSIRWVRWSKFDITPTHFTTTVSADNSLVDYDKPTITYNLGVGRRFNENWSGAISVGYEKSGGGISGNLGPTDGFRSVGLGATYTVDNIKISGGVQYRKVGNATTEIGPLTNSFTGNSAWSAGMRVGFSF